MFSVNDQNLNISVIANFQGQFLDFVYRTQSNNFITYHCQFHNEILTAVVAQQCYDHMARILPSNPKLPCKLTMLIKQDNIELFSIEKQVSHPRELVKEIHQYIDKFRELTHEKTNVVSLNNNRCAIV